ncbi:DUF177 domain-containing protein [Cryobacterium sp. BB307]|uniref:YceD family protein n=1 Tax=unclassified Cryobacterium TaxID=2649013 RepID=UPI0032C1455E
MEKTSSPYLINVRDLIHRPGEQRERDLEITTPDELANAVIGVRAGEPISVKATLESLHDGILVSAEVDSTARGECVRCLIDISQEVEVDIQEVFAYSVDEAFDYEVQGDHVNLEPVIRDAVVLSLPFQPVCQPDCPGLCPQCGVRLLDEPGHKHEEQTDPRWSALAALAGEPQNPGETGTKPGAETEER